MKNIFYPFILLISFSFLLFSVSAPAQVSVDWDQTYGGYAEDGIYDMISTPDGGYLLAGLSYSYSDPDAQNADYWIVKIDGNGNKQWDKSFGGRGDEELRSIFLTSDGGYLLVGNSESEASGDKSEDSRGALDYWVVKTDNNGNKIWDKSFGGRNVDLLRDATTTSDGGYLLIGNSSKIVRIDANGNKLWDKIIGESSSDWLYSGTSTPDGGYLLGGSSLTKIDANGNIQWEKPQSARIITASSDGGYLLGIDSDYTIIKVDAEGNKLWDKSFGGSSVDRLRSITSTSDGGYLLGGFSASSASGDKSEDSKGREDYWVVRIDANGNKLWDKTIGGSDMDWLFSTISTPDGGYLLGGWSFSNASGDKSENSHGVDDGWIVKVKEEQAEVAVTGFSLMDADNNKVLRSIEEGDVIDLNAYENENFNILAHTEPENIGSVIMELEGMGGIAAEKLLVRKTENKVPYALFGDKDQNDFRNWQPEGMEKGYTLTATPYVEENKGGMSGKALTVKFELIEKDYDQNGVEPVASSELLENDQVGHVKFVLVDADNNVPLQTLEEGDEINLQQYPAENFNIHIIPREHQYIRSVAVELKLNNSLYIDRKENVSPYAAFGDRRGDYRNWQPERGWYTLKADVHNSSFGRGEMLSSRQIRFHIIDEPVVEQPAVAARSEGAALSVYPNPAVSQVQAKASAEADQPYQLSVFNAFGEKVFHKSGKGSFEEMIDLNRQQPGLYMVVIESQGQREVKRLLVKK